MTNKPLLVGGPLLGERSTFTKDRRAAAGEIPKDLSSWNTFEPYITPLLSNEQFILLPSGSFVTVLAYKTGRRVACLIPFMKDEETNNIGMIESACVATFPAPPEKSQNVTEALRKLGDDMDASEAEDESEESHVLLVGCRDGTIREFDLTVLTRKQRGDQASSMSCGDYEVPGPCYRPRRVMSITDKQPIKHLTAPSQVILKSGGALLYALIEKNPLKSDGGKSKPSAVYCCLLRVQLPPFDRRNDNNTNIIKLGNEKKGSFHTVAVQDTLKCLVGFDIEKKFQNALPFRLLSVSRKASRTFSDQDSESDRDVFIVIARTKKLHLYHERIKSGESHGKMQTTSFPNVDRYNILSSVSISPNGTDVTCGNTEGEICVMSDVLPQTLDYFQQVSEGIKSPPHPSTTALTRRVHWHAHPVTSLAYQAATGTVDPILYSGGFESVLVTWQLSRGTYRPADVLPRLAKGGIVHICCSDQEGGILVYCEDNSLQLFAAHNKSRLWKVQGLASSTGDSVGTSNASVLPTIRAGLPTASNNLILSGLPGAPGYLHWYDIQLQQVTAQLEVAPFNRVSRTEQEDSPMPVPSVTHCAFSESGRDLVTIDTMPTENAGIGATERIPNGNAIGVVSTVRFWSLNSVDKNKNLRAGPYSLTAAMTHPHGDENRVTAVAISRDGQYACTASNDENAFRLWHKVLSENADELDTDSKSRRTPVWLCRFKVTTPSGYSNFRSGSNAVGFSSDGSILAICYGYMITLWDHKEATLLTSLQHLEDDRAPVESLAFVKTRFLNDLILTFSRSGVALQSPYGNGKDSWSFVLPANYEDGYVSHAELIPSHDLVVVCITFHNRIKSRILLLDAATGTPQMEKLDDKAVPLEWELPGMIRSIGVDGKATKSSNWHDITSSRNGKPGNEALLSIRLYVTTSDGDIVLLRRDGASSGSEASVSLFQQPTSAAATDAPRLNMLKRGAGQKRRRKEASAQADVTALKKRVTGFIFGALLEDEGAECSVLHSSDLPALSGSFTRAFINRNLVPSAQGVRKEDS